MTSFLDLFGGDVVTSVTTLLNGVLDRVAPDQTVAMQLKARLAEITAQGELQKMMADVQLSKGQLDINLAEAKNVNWWVAGWRPFIGWICGTILLNNYVMVPYVDFIAKLCHSTIQVPVLDWNGVAPILITLLGGGSMLLRSYEKRTGVQGRH